MYDECNAVGGMARHTFDIDPKRLTFVLARYKHTAKLLSGYNRVLEVGCSDGYASRIVRQHVGHLTAIDVDPDAIKIAQANDHPDWPITYLCYDFFKVPAYRCDAVYALDLFEHIQDGEMFLRRMRWAAPVAVIGTPSLESQVHASELSRQGHVNCMNADQLKAAMLQHWRHVFVFGLNDETLHTGFGPMCHYLLALGVG